MSNLTAPSIERVHDDVADEDLAAIARIHREEIIGGFLSTLGDKFLTLLYRTLAGSPYAFVFVARLNGRVVGFICGATSAGRVYRDFFRRAGLAALPALLPKVLSVRSLVRVLETLFYPRRSRAHDLPESEILNFCVSGAVQGRGVGKALFRALVGEFHSRGVPRIRIVTGNDQRSAQNFYDRVGATRAGRISVHRSSPSVVYVYTVW